MDTGQLLDFCCEMGRQLTINGAEIYRVEDSLERILRAYGYQSAEVFAIPSFIIITVHSETEGCTRSVRIHSLSNNMNRLYELNNLCRNVCRETPSITKAQELLDKVLHMPVYSTWISYLGYGGAALFFTLFWGGTFLDAGIAFGCGVVTRFIVRSLQRLRANVFFLNVISSILIAFIPLLLSQLGISNNSDKVIIGTIMILVPGIAITNAMRDVLAGDFLTAIIRLAEVLIVAVAIATGIAIAIGAISLIF